MNFGLTYKFRCLPLHTSRSVMHEGLHSFPPLYRLEILRGWVDRVTLKGVCLNVTGAGGGVGKGRWYINYQI